MNKKHSRQNTEAFVGETPMGKSGIGGETHLTADFNNLWMERFIKD
jgi:hypothetical protein